MEQHPIPQNVTAYEFHLIGNMTIKQFAELGGGIILAVILYSTQLTPIFKWPLIVFSAVGGAALAFLPFDGRPLDRMVLVFFRAVYAPTQFIWRRTPNIPKYFTYKTHKIKLNAHDTEKQRLRKNLTEYLETLPDQPEPSKLDVSEAQQLYDITQMFDQVAPASNVTPSTSTVATSTQSPKVRIRKMKEQKELKLPPNKVAFTAKAASIQIPEITPIKVSPSAPTPAETATPTNTPDQPQSLPHSKAAYTPQADQTTAATQNQDLPFPSLPDQPNLIVGMVLDSAGHIVEDAIIEIRDTNHMPIRALKSNRLGQFFSATPLKNGHYEIEAEKDGLNYGVFTIDLNGKIIPPLEIRAQNTLS